MGMKIELNWISKSAKHARSGYYEEVDDFSALPQDKIKAICAFCYYDEKYVIVKNGPYWEPVAGHVEEGETGEEALIREIKEEANMKVLKYFPVGYLYIKEVDVYQTRYLCVVEPYGPFVSDPDGDVTEIKLVLTEDLTKFVAAEDTALLMTKKCLNIVETLR
jgi:8-oxo-dGTP pyrophosphatase MutT (NUDIX family)